MTKLLEQALSEVQKLSNTNQDAIAAIILAELTDEERWEAAFAGSQDQLAQMAENVRADIHAARIVDKGMGDKRASQANAAKKWGE